ncbi:hypothetical protein RZO07_22330 [Pseudomonas protegens]|nr:MULTISPECIES: hypothetical protein [Pseudomonas]MCL9654629.1 hypothetical protein [Pseudomonas protegens]MDP4569189.1 hypothetical protein [Pseudomonas sp. LPH60]WOE78011.1 hypothetical protein RZO07_22330 [Pseudomonas protegens]
MSAKRWRKEKNINAPLRVSTATMAPPIRFEVEPVVMLELHEMIELALQP